MTSSDVATTVTQQAWNNSNDDNDNDVISSSQEAVVAVVTVSPPQEESKNNNNNNNNNLDDDSHEGTKADDAEEEESSSPGKEGDEDQNKTKEEEEEEEESSPKGDDDPNETIEEEHGEEVMDETKDAKRTTPVNLPPRPLKRARTAYFIFTDEKRSQVQAEHPGEGVAAQAKALGKLWGGLSPEEKKGYQQKAAQERARVAKKLEEWRAAGGSVLEEEDAEHNKSSSSSSSLSNHPLALVFPAARIRKICKLDPEVRGLSKEALMLVTKCAELATAKLGTETVKMARLQNRRKLLPEDVAHVCSHREQFMFLKEDVKDLVQSLASQAAEVEKPKKGDSAREAAAVGSKPLTAYFGGASKEVEKTD